MVGVLCDAAEGNVVWAGGETGVPLELTEPDLSFALWLGTGSHWCPSVGLAGSKGGALRLFLGIEATGCECSTSLQLAFGSRKRHHTPSSRTYFMRLHLLRKVASIRCLNSMIPASSLAFVGFAA